MGCSGVAVLHALTLSSRMYSVQHTRSYVNSPGGYNCSFILHFCTRPRSSLQPFFCVYDTIRFIYIYTISAITHVLIINVD